MYGFVIAIMLCSGSSCDMLQAEPDVSYPSYAACHHAMAAKSTALQTLAKQHARHDWPARIVCLHPLNTIVEVEEPHEVLDTAIVHSEPSASALYVGLVEKGKRTLVTGLVAGTEWVRVLLPDGKSGYVFADHLRRVAEQSPTGAPPRDTALAAVPPPVVPAAPSAAAPSAENPSPSVAPASIRQAVVTPPPAPPPPAGTFRDCETCPVMLSLPGGSFEMGSGEDYSEQPRHRVAIRPFALGVFEVTVAEWNACVAEAGCSYKPPAEAMPASRPVSNLSWDDAGQYVQWLRKRTGKPYRLPSESEWEYAAAAGSATRYAWGEQPGIGKADCRGCGGAYDERRPANIGSFAANAWGLHDMLGGVAEWVDDCWHLSYKGAPANGMPWRERYCSKHVLRGGSWMNPPGDIAVRTRNFYDTDVRYPGNGVRVALTLP